MQLQLPRGGQASARVIRFVSRGAGNRPQRETETFLPHAPPGARAAVTGAGCADQWTLSLPSSCLVQQRGLRREPLPGVGQSWGCRKGPGHGPDLLSWASSVLLPRRAGAGAPARLTVTCHLPPAPPRRWSTVGVTRGAWRLLREAGRGAGAETLSPGEVRGGAGTPQVGLGTPAYRCLCWIREGAPQETGTASQPSEGGRAQERLGRADGGGRCWP